MAYSIDRADLIADQLQRLVHWQVHQLAGQIANLDFWLDEAAAALGALDDYPRRFRLLRDAQAAWVDGHGTIVSGYCPHCGGACELGPRKPDAPRRLSSDEVDSACKHLRRSARNLLLRCYRARLIDEPVLRAACDRLGINVEPEDLDRD